MIPLGNPRNTWHCWRSCGGREHCSTLVTSTTVANGPSSGARGGYYQWTPSCQDMRQVRGAAGGRWSQKAIGPGVVDQLLLYVFVCHLDRNTSGGVS